MRRNRRSCHRRERSKAKRFLSEFQVLHSPSPTTTPSTYSLSLSSPRTLPQPPIYFNPLVRENVTSVVVQRRSKEAEVCGTPVARNFHDIVGEVINARNKWEQLPLRSHLIFWADFKFGQNGSRSRDRTLLISIRTRLYIITISFIFIHFFFSLC